MTDHFHEHEFPDYDLLIKQRKENPHMKVKSVHTVTVEVPIATFHPLQVEVQAAGTSKRKLMLTSTSDKSVADAKHALRRFVKGIEMRVEWDDDNDPAGHAPG